MEQELLNVIAPPLLALFAALFSVVVKKVIDILSAAHANIETKNRGEVMSLVYDVVVDVTRAIERSALSGYIANEAKEKKAAAVALTQKYLDDLGIYSVSAETIAGIIETVILDEAHKAVQDLWMPL